MSNLKATIQAGLQKDYNGVFNLNAAEISTALTVDVVIDGDHYVESGNPGYQHGGVSNYGEYEGILPVDSVNSDWEHYGVKLSTKLYNYMPNLITGFEQGELWEGRYNQYANQFYLKFDQDGETNSLSHQYLSYLNTPIAINSKKIIKYKLGQLMDNGLNLTTYIVHFSKYYNIYNTTSGGQMVLKPLLYYDTDLSTYNLAIKEQTVGDKPQGIPYIDTLITLKWYRNEPGWTRHENCYHNSSSFDPSTETYEGRNRLVDDYKRSSSGDDWSQFHTNPEGREVFENWNPENWNRIPQGFSTWMMEGSSGGNVFFTASHGYFFNKQNVGGMNDTDKLPTIYRSIFNIQDPRLWRDSTTGGLYGSAGQDFLMGIMFRHDKDNNWHIFNTYFPVVSKNGKPTQEIRYNNTGPYPKYVGLIVASILANIYTYSDEVSGVSKYISDIVFLEDHSTIYTKDIAYRIYKNPESEKTDNDLLLFHKRDFNTYLRKLKSFINTNDDPDHKFNENNVTLHLDECVKNVPIQFKLNYTKPELSVIGEKATVKILKITGEEVDCAADIVRPNRLYWVEDDNVKYLGKDFKIKWLKYLNRVEDKLQGEWDDTLTDIYNPYMYKMFNYNEGRLDFETTGFTVAKNGQCYSIYSYRGSFGNVLYDLLTNDILVPTARVI